MADLNSHKLELEKLGVDFKDLKEDDLQYYDNFESLLDSKNYILTALQSKPDFNLENENILHPVDSKIVDYATSLKDLDPLIRSLINQNKEKIKLSFDQVKGKSQDEICDIIISKALSNQNVLKVPMNTLSNLISSKSQVTKSILPSNEINQFADSLALIHEELKNLGIK